MPRLALITLLATLLALPPVTLAQTGDLPALGDAGGAAISRDQEYQLGRMIMRQLRDSGALLEDPATEEYIQTLGRKLASRAHEGQHRFTFFVVNDPRLNAFALPGGFIGVHHGLILATKNESELAAVLAHEIAHVTQKHIARMIQAQGQTGLMTAAAIMAAVILGSATGAGGDAIQAAMTVAQGAAIQSQINFTRDNEYEADRVGINILSTSGFDTRAMASFFETMGRYSGLASQRVPEFLQTHPVSSERIAEARNRIALLPQLDVESSLEWQLARARIRVMSADLPDDAVAFFESQIPKDQRDWAEANRYGYALALLQSSRPVDAAEHFKWLRDKRENVIAYHIGLARAYLAAGDTGLAMVTYEDAHKLFPRNVPLTMHYGEALIQAGKAKQAHTMLLDLVNNLNYTPSQVRLLALAASAAGDTADAHYYMSEVHVLSGNLLLATGQLELALASPNLDDVQRARFEARLDEIREHLPQNRKKKRRQPSSDEQEDAESRRARR
ncbi:MAG: M48 family metallopeptidase [Gammaproteobacteria bacterium]|nr:M48 family metallopeptidase [Gammaproteobacteria bacterium]